MGSIDSRMPHPMNADLEQVKDEIFKLDQEISTITNLHSAKPSIHNFDNSDGLSLVNNPSLYQKSPSPLMTTTNQTKRRIEINNQESSNIPQVITGECQLDDDME